MYSGILVAKLVFQWSCQIICISECDIICIKLPTAILEETIVWSVRRLGMSKLSIFIRDTFVAHVMAIIRPDVCYKSCSLREMTACRIRTQVQCGAPSYFSPHSSQ